MKRKRLSVLGVPMDLGQMRRGVDMGPSAIRYAGLTQRLEKLGFQVKDEGNVVVVPASKQGDMEKLRNLEETIETNKEIQARVRTIMEQDRFPLVLGGDHSISIGTVSAINEQYGDIGVIWYDAHGDLNTPETSPSGNIHGMSLAVNLGIGHPLCTALISRALKPENVVLIGARDLDEGEKRLIKEIGMKVFTMHEVDLLGMTEVMRQTLKHLSHVEHLHLSLDLDALDPLECPGVGTPVRGGLTYRESHLAMELLADSGKMKSAEFVEVNTILDEKNKTAEVAVALIGSLFGEKLL